MRGVLHAVARESERLTPEEHEVLADFGALTEGRLIEKLFALDTRDCSPAACPPVLFRAAPWRVARLDDERSRVAEVKSGIGMIDESRWNALAEDAALAYGVVRHVRNSLAPEFCAVGWLKLAELLAQFPALLAPLHRSRESEGSLPLPLRLRTLHLCELPGAFVAALNHHVRTRGQAAGAVDWRWVATSLNPCVAKAAYAPKKRTASATNAEEMFLSATLPHWFFGPDVALPATARERDELRARLQAEDGHAQHLHAADIRNPAFIRALWQHVAVPASWRARATSSSKKDVDADVPAASENDDGEDKDEDAFAVDADDVGGLSQGEESSGDDKEEEEQEDEQKDEQEEEEEERGGTVDEDEYNNDDGWCDLVTADGTHPYSLEDDRFNSEEQLSGALWLAEIVAGLGCLRRGGGMLLRMSSMFEATTLGLLFLLACHFDTVTVCKPFVSKSSNNEVYVVCCGFRRAVAAEHMTQLMRQVEANFGAHDPVPVAVALRDLPPSFQASVLRCALLFSQLQRAYLERLFRLWAVFTPLERHGVRLARLAANATWAVRFGVRPIRDAQTLVPHGKLRHRIASPNARPQPPRRRRQPSSKKHKQPRLQ